MYCTYHNQNPILSICIASHKCSYQRKLCHECSYTHGVDIKYTIPIKQFQEKALQQLQDNKLDQTSEITKMREAFKSLLSQTQSIMQTVWNNLSDSIKSLYDMIEQENNSYINLISQNPAESSYTDLEKLVSIVEGKLIYAWNAQKNSYLILLEKVKNGWDHGIEAFVQHSNEVIKKMQFIKMEWNLVEGEVYQRKEDLWEILASVSEIDEQIYEGIIDEQRKEKIQDIILFISKQINLKQYESFVNQQQTTSDVKKKIINVLRNILDHQFNRNDYSTNTYKKVRQNLIKKITVNNKIVYFLKFLVQLTSIDNKYIQSGSNALNLLVQMKANLSNQSFEDIRIKNTTLIGANFVRCNLSGSKLENVDISGVNLNGALLLNCKWKNIKIQELNKFDGHISNVFSVCFSPDGTTLTSGSEDKSIRLWDVKTGQQKAKLDGQSDYVRSVCFSPDGTTLVSGGGDMYGGGDCSIRLWDVKTGKQKAKLNPHTNCINQVCFSSDGTTLASAYGDKSIRLWDIKTGQQKAKLDGHTNCINSVCFSPDGTTVASGSSDKSIRIWEVITGQQKAKLDGHTNCINSVCFSPDGTTLASGSSDKSIRIWDVKTGQQKAKLDGHTNCINSVCFSPDGTTLASGSSDKSIRIWDVITGQQKTKLDGHTNCINSVCFSPDGTTLASGCDDRSIRLWDVTTRQQKVKLNGHSNWVRSVCFSSDGTTLASGGYDQSIRLWDVKTGQQKAKFYSLSNYVCSVCLSPDGTTLASGSGDRQIRLWDVKTGQQKAQLDCHTNWVRSVCFSSDGITLASGSDDNSIRLWDVKTGQYIQHLDLKYKDLLAQFKLLLHQNNHFAESASYLNILLISKSAIFQAKGALILQGEFNNHQGYDLKQLLKWKGSYFLNSCSEQIHKKN